MAGLFVSHICHTEVRSVVREGLEGIASLGVFCQWNQTANARVHLSKDLQRGTWFVWDLGGWGPWGGGRTRCIWSEGWSGMWRQRLHEAHFMHPERDLVRRQELWGWSAGGTGQRHAAWGHCWRWRTEGFVGGIGAWPARRDEVQRSYVRWKDAIYTAGSCSGHRGQVQCPVPIGSATSLGQRRSRPSVDLQRAVCPQSQRQTELAPASWRNILEGVLSAIVCSLFLWNQWGFQALKMIAVSVHVKCMQMFMYHIVT